MAMLRSVALLWLYFKSMERLIFLISVPALSRSRGSLAEFLLAMAAAEDWRAEQRAGQVGRVAGAGLQHLLHTISSHTATLRPPPDHPGQVARHGPALCLPQQLLQPGLPGPGVPRHLLANQRRLFQPVDQSELTWPGFSVQGSREVATSHISVPMENTSPSWPGCELCRVLLLALSSNMGRTVFTLCRVQSPALVAAPAPAPTSSGAVYCVLCCPGA